MPKPVSPCGARTRAHLRARRPYHGSLGRARMHARRAASLRAPPPPVPACRAHARPRLPRRRSPRRQALEAKDSGASAPRRARAAGSCSAGLALTRLAMAAWLAFTMPGRAGLPTHAATTRAPAQVGCGPQIGKLRPGSLRVPVPCLARVCAPHEALL